jgi:hypothetical protein
MYQLFNLILNIFLIQAPSAQENGTTHGAQSHILNLFVIYNKIAMSQPFYSSIETFWGTTVRPVGGAIITKGMRGQYRGIADSVQGQSGCACGGEDSLCDTCNLLRKHVDFTEIGPVENKDQLFDFESQFNTPLAGWTNTMKDSAMRNGGSLGETNAAALGIPFKGKILPPTFKHGADVHKTHDKCYKAGGVDNVRYVNAYREALDNCEMYCGHDVCKEYGNALEKYGQCVRMNNCKDKSECLRKCGNPPINPRLNGCGKKKGCCSQFPHHQGLPFPKVTPYNACKRHRHHPDPKCPECHKVKLIPGGRCC